MDLEGTIITLAVGLFVGWITSAGVSAQWKRRVKAFIHAVEVEFQGSNRSVKDAFKAGEFGDDLKVKALLDVTDPIRERSVDVIGGASLEPEPRVSGWAKALDVVKNLLPFVALFRK